MPEVENVLDMLVEDASPASVAGEYDRATQTWSHRDQARLSPQKHHQEQ